MKVAPVPVLGLIVTVVDLVPVVVGLNVTAAIHVCPAVSVVLAQPLTVKSVGSVLEKGVEPKITAPPLAVRVTAEQAIEAPTLTFAQVELPLTVT